MEEKITVVLWSDTARKDLQEIYDYYSQFSESIALKILEGIIIRAEGLIIAPLIGRIEDLLLEKNKEYRFVVEGYYKLIYSIENNHIAIHRIFDARQNPEKLLIP